MIDEIVSAGSYTYNGFADSLKDLMGHLVGQGAYLCQARQSELLSLHGLLQLRRVRLIDPQLILQLKSGVEMSFAYFTYCAVTNEAAHAKNISNHRLVMRLAEHEGNKLANCREKHHDVIRCLRRI